MIRVSSKALHEIQRTFVIYKLSDKKIIVPTSQKNNFKGLYNDNNSDTLFKKSKGDFQYKDYWFPKDYSIKDFFSIFKKSKVPPNIITLYSKNENIDDKSTCTFYHLYEVLNELPSSNYHIG